VTAAEAGASAPDFELRDQHAESHRLSSYRDRKNVVLVFYPFAFTGVCTRELGAIRDDIGSLQNDDVQVLAVSCDPVASLRAFADREGFEHPLLSDFWPHGATAREYGVFNDVIGAAERATFVIDRSGVIRWTVRTGLGEPRDVSSYQKALSEISGR
jgi:peroxiredoxin